MVAAAAYVDPGNVASNTTAGATYGYMLVWVIVVANFMAAMVQYLSAKLGVVSGHSLPEVVGERVPRIGRLAYWLQAELVAMATDVAEILGGAIALLLLFGLPLIWGGVFTAAGSMLILATRDRGGTRLFERVIVGMLFIVAVGFVAGLFIAPPKTTAVRGLVPRFSDTDSVLVAAAMLGATVMPHAIYAHSSIARDRHGFAFGPALARLLAATRTDVFVALFLAGGVNLALLMLGATTLTGPPEPSTLESVHGAIGEALGSGVAVMFAIALLFSGLASTAVGSYAGAVVMGGLLRRAVPLLVRRAVTAIPALVLIALSVEPTRALVFSQVMLSFGIPFALIPLVIFTSRRTVMGAARNGRATVVAASGVCTMIVGLNIALLVLLFTT